MTNWTVSTCSVTSLLCLSVSGLTEPTVFSFLPSTNGLSSLTWKQSLTRSCIMYIHKCDFAGFGTVESPLPHWAAVSVLEASGPPASSPVPAPRPSSCFLKQRQRNLKSVSSEGCLFVRGSSNRPAGVSVSRWSNPPPADRHGFDHFQTSDWAWREKRLLELFHTNDE